MTLKNNRVPLLYYVKLLHYFKAIGEFKLELESWSAQFGSRFRFFVPCDLEIRWMTLTNNRTIAYLFFTTLSFVHHFKAIGKFKLQLESRNAQFVSKFGIFGPCELEIWGVTMKNNRVPLQCHFKLCASLHSHHGILTGVTVRKRQIRVKIGNFLSRVTLKFDGWYWKNKRVPLLYYVKHCASIKGIGEFKLQSQSWNSQFGSKLRVFLSRVT